MTLPELEEQEPFRGPLVRAGKFALCPNKLFPTRGRGRISCVFLGCCWYFHCCQVVESCWKQITQSMEPGDRVVLIAVDDSEDSQKAFVWAIENVYREGDQIHLVHVVPRLAFAAQYGVPPVDFVPAAENSTYESAVQRAEQFIIDRFVKQLPANVKAPVVHIIKVGFL